MRHLLVIMAACGVLWAPAAQAAETAQATETAQASQARVGVEAFVLSAPFPLSTKDFKWPGYDGKRDVMTPEEVVLRNRIARANNLGGAGVALMVLGAASAGGLFLANTIVEPTSSDADTAYLIGYIASGAVGATGVVLTGVGYGQAARLKKKLPKVAVVPVLGPKHNGLAMVARW